MSLDRRLREEFVRAAGDPTRAVDPDVLTHVVSRAGSIRRNRRIGASLTVMAALVTATLVTTGFPLGQDRSDGQVPATTPTPTPWHTPMTLTFASRMNGFSSSYPDGWTATPGTRMWRHGEEEPPRAADRFRAPIPQTRVITVVSQAIPAGMTDDEWIADFLPDPGDVQVPSCFPPREQWEPVVVDGHQGGIFGGTFQCLFTQAVVIADHRAYIITGLPYPDHYSPDLFDLGLLKDFLASMRLTPDTAG